MYRALVPALLVVTLLGACKRAETQPSSNSMSDTMPMPGSPSTASPTPAPPMADAQMQSVLDQLAALGGKPIETLSPAEARKQPTPADAVKALIMKRGQTPAPEPVASVENRSIDGPGGKIAIRIYKPAGTGTMPVILYIHGGGWVLADLDVYDSSPRALANAAKAIVVSTHYRQGPEYRFPSAHDDTLAAYQWTVSHAASLGGDPAKSAVAGESAGGNMAASIAIEAKKRHLPMPVHQLLVYPVANYAYDTESYAENENAKPLNKKMMQWFFNNYLATPVHGNNPRIAILKEQDLSGLPPATIITAQIDPLRSEGKAYADRLQAAGVAVRYRNYEGVTHEFFGMGAVVDKAKDAVAFAAEGLRGSFGN